MIWIDLDDIDGEMMKNMFDGYSVNVLTVFFVFFWWFQSGDLIRQPSIGDVIVLRVNMCKPGHFWVI